MQSLTRIALSAVLYLSLCACASQTAAPNLQAVSQQATNAATQTKPSVKIAYFEYSPKALTVKAGTTVRFVNSDTESHTVTSTTGLFTSAVLFPGRVYGHKFAKAGRFKYYCKIHTFMHGEVVVKP